MTLGLADLTEPLSSATKAAHGDFARAECDPSPFSLMR